jgi:predicted DNA binding CopG/RHH family protein
MTKAKKPGTAQAWESGELGENADSVKVASAETTKAINDALGLQMISIRLPKSVIDDFKVIAQIEGIGYQPLMRIALTRFAEYETKRVMREYAARIEADKKNASTAQAMPNKHVGRDPKPERKAA